MATIQYSTGTDWNASHPSCCHFGWSLPSRLTVQYCVCFMLNHLHFLSFFDGIKPCNFQKQILVRIVTLSDCRLRAIRSKKWLECYVIRIRQQNFTTQPRHLSPTSVEASKSQESDHSVRIQTVNPNGHWQSFHPSCSSVLGDDPLISEEVASSEHGILIRTKNEK